MKCPKCGLFNPDSAMRCDCGYDFESAQVKESYAGEEAVMYSGTVSSGIRLVNFLVDLIFLNIVVGVCFVTFLQKGDTLLPLVIVIFYYFIFETILQRTPAKFITGTKVVAFDGSKPEAVAILVRTFCRLIPLEQISGLFSNNRIWWHDSLSKTKVVKN